MSEARTRGRQKTVITVISRIAERQALPTSCLVIIYGAELGRRYALDKAEFVLGRSAQSDILVDQESVSRQHAKIIVTARETTLKDLGSTNGTYINDELCGERELRDGDYVKVGRTIFKYLTGTNVEASYHEEIYRLTTVDGLTKAYNRRYLQEQVAREISRSTRYGRPLSLVWLDVDDFQRLNQDNGHLAGDAVLTQVAALIRRNIRREDVLARVEGDGFAFILPETDGDRARQFSEKIRRLVEQQAFAFEGVTLKLSVSMGVSSVTGQAPHPTAEQFLKVAEENVALAKKQGRNRVAG